MLSHSVVFNSLQPHRLQPARLLCPWDFPGKNTGVGCHFLLQKDINSLISKVSPSRTLMSGEEIRLRTQATIHKSHKATFPPSGGSVIKNPPANAGATGDVGSIPGLERSPGVGNGNPLQYSCLGNPMHRRAWQAHP